MMKWLSCFLIVAFSLTVAAPASAECVTVLEARLDSDCIVMQYGSQRGVWFRLDKADALRRAYVIAPELQLQLDAYQEAMDLRDGQLSDLRSSIQAHKEIQATLKRNSALLTSRALEAERVRDEALKKQRSWHRSPFLWFGTGVLATVGIGVAASLAVSK